jgi:hypothetical protein
MRAGSQQGPKNADCSQHREVNHAIPRRIQVVIPAAGIFQDREEYITDAKRNHTVVHQGCGHLQSPEHYANHDSDEDEHRLSTN